MFASNQLLRTRHFVFSALLAVVGLGLLTTTASAQLSDESAYEFEAEIESRKMLEARQSILDGVDFGPGKAELIEAANREFEQEIMRLSLENERKKQQLEQLGQLEEMQQAEMANAFVVDSPEKMEAFRRVARKLEDSAWALEEVGAYDFADSLRDQADRLRHQARNFKN